ncbi:serpin B6-like [Onychostruthus taczanowskii]|uniref:serpin B6-like n=1 Tax=Onychostruthus taczanowskii TaxID=356909 RepID=UPI001B80DA66|nr:serpin B6-like [Onychostruthus taczanowskii]
MMFKEADFNMTYIGDFQTKILELPYVGNELSMIILLPDAIQDGSTGLERLEKELTYEKLMFWISPEMMSSTEVKVYLPRFKLEEAYKLKPILGSMGMPDAFELGKADFSGISPGNQLVLSEVVHKSFVEVNEEGTEAAAATAMLFSVPAPSSLILILGLAGIRELLRQTEHLPCPTPPVPVCRGLQVLADTRTISLALAALLLCLTSLLVSSRQSQALREPM